MSRTDELVAETMESLESGDLQRVHAGIRLAAKLFDSWMGTPTSFVDPELEGLALEGAHVDQIKKTLISLLSTVDQPKVKGSIVWALGRYPQGEFVELFSGLIENPENCDPYLLYQVLLGLTNCGEEVFSGDMRGFEHHSENVKDAQTFLSSRKIDGQ